MISNDQLNNLIDDHKMCGISAYRGGDLMVVIFISGTIEALEELKQRRECELRPATKFIKSTLFQHNDKLTEEFNEVQEAFYNYTENSLDKDKEHLIEEIIDVQLVGETWLAGLGLNETDRMKARQKKMAENKARGYYDEK